MGEGARIKGMEKRAGQENQECIGGHSFGINTPPEASGYTFVTPSVKGLQQTGRGAKELTELYRIIL